MKKKTELLTWQKTHVKADGLLIFWGHQGQVRRYGPSIYEFEVIDVYGQYEPDEVLQFMAVREGATIPETMRDGEYPTSLSLVVMAFKQLSPHCYFFKCGHDYTD